jgi:hypothetical protein
VLQKQLSLIEDSSTLQNSDKNDRIESLQAIVKQKTQECKLYQVKIESQKKEIAKLMSKQSVKSDLKAL